MDKIVVMRIAGIVLFAFGVLAFIYGILTNNKFMDATGFMSLIVGSALLYYTSKLLSEIK
jgi:hypothetical protein